MALGGRGCRSGRGDRRRDRRRVAGAARQRRHAALSGRLRAWLRAGEGDAMNALRPLLWLLALALCACGAELDTNTQLVLEIDSDLRVPQELDQVSVRLEGAEAQAASADLLQGGLPRSLGLVHAGGPLGPFLVHVVGTREGAVVVESSRRVTFAANRTLHVPLFLASACL